MTTYRRRRRGILFAIAATVGVILGTIGGAPAHGVYANSSTSASRYVQMIDWLDWTEVTGAETCTYTVGRVATTGQCIPADPNRTATMWSTPALAGSASDGQTTYHYLRATRCALKPTYTDTPQRSNGILLYEPGAYRGDGLARLVNDGANYNGGGTPKAWTLDGNFRSGHVIGLANQYEGHGLVGTAPPGVVDIGDPGIVTFSVSCDTYLFRVTTSSMTKRDLEQQHTNTSVAKKMPMEGMVVADAESSNWDGRHHEYSQVSSPNNAYRLLETYRSQICRAQESTSVAEPTSWTDTDGNHVGYRIRSLGQQCSTTTKDPAGDPIPTAAGPTAIMFMEDATSLNVRLAGNGRSAIALGVVSYMDFGDAPTSYGVASAAFQPTWSGGTIPNTTTGTNLFTGGVGLATAGAAVPRLGALIDAEQVQPNSVGADADDLVGSDDEDGWRAVDIQTAPGATYSTTVSCTGTGQVRGWIDWNRDGDFADEKDVSSTASCGAATPTVSLTWTVPSDVKRSVAGETQQTYLRLRISGDRDAANALVAPDATGATTTGEVEDYAVNVYVPTVQLVKQVDNTAAGTLGLAATHWTLTGTQGARTLTGAGSAPETVVAPGTVSLTESSTVDGNSAYTASQWTCRQADRTKNPVNYTYSSTVSSTAPNDTLTVNNVDRVICEITNTANPGSLTWTKVDGAAQPLGGATFTVNGPSAAQVSVADCVAAPCPTTGVVDTNPNPGVFTVTDLTWGDYTITETVPPAGYTLTGQTATGTLKATTPNLTLDLGKITNQPNHLTWTKVDADNNKLLGGSEWTLEPSDGATIPAITIGDCVRAGCTGPDLDPDPGEFDLTRIPAGSYTLTETKAPAGYQIGTPVQVVVKANDTTVTLDPVKNDKQEVPPLPLTGGAASDLFLIVGGGAGLLALVVAGIRRRRR